MSNKRQKHSHAGAFIALRSSLQGVMMEQKTIIITNDTNPNGPPRRQAMLQRHAELIEHYANQSDDKDVVFLLLDCDNCSVGKFIRNALLDEKTCDTLKSQIATEGTFNTTLFMMARWQLYKLLRAIQRDLHIKDARNPASSPIVEKIKVPAEQGSVHVIAISQGKQYAEVKYSR